MNYFVSTEIGISNLLQRQFDWTANTLFFEEIPHSRDPARNKFIVANDDVVYCAPVSSQWSHSFAKRLTIRIAHQEVPTISRRP